jgi:hypothetical protein
MQNEERPIFGPDDVISTYTDRQAIEDGILVAINERDRVTRTVWEYLVTKQPGGSQPPSNWPVAMMGWFRAAAMPKSEAAKIIAKHGAEETLTTTVESAFADIEKAIGASCTDSVNLRDGRAMIVDDNGYDTKTIDHGGGRFEIKTTRARKPVNEKATKLYWSVCRPGTTHQIVGDVAIVNDADFADGDDD